MTLCCAPLKNRKWCVVRGAHVMGIHKILAILPRISIRGNWARAGGNTR